MKLKHALLFVLSAEDYRNFLLPEETIFHDLHLRLPTPATMTEIREELRQLELKRLVVSVRDELTNEAKWKITDAGRAILAEKR